MRGEMHSGGGISVVLYSFLSFRHGVILGHKTALAFNFFLSRVISSEAKSVLNPNPSSFIQPYQPLHIPTDNRTTVIRPHS
jgi:hypothetical protein